MKIEWFVINVKAVRSPNRAQRAILGMVLAGRVFGHFRPYLLVVAELLCDVGTPS